MTPLKFFELATEIQKAEFHPPHPALDWVARFMPAFEKLGAGQPEPFRRIRINRYLTKYVAPASAQTAEKTLVFCLSGAAQRMMMPLANFLQQFDANLIDIVLLKCPGGAGYHHGLPGLATTFDDMIDRLGRILEAQGTYARRVVMGTSVGALPAVICGLRFQYAAVLAVGIGPPNDEQWLEATGGPDAPKISMYAASSPNTKVYLMHGKDCAEDVAGANALSKIIPAKLISIGGIDQAMGHGCLWPLAASGKLKQVLADTILKPDSLVAEQLAHRANL